MNILLIDHIGSFTKNIAEGWRADGHTVVQSAKLKEEEVAAADLVFCEWAWENAFELAQKRLPVPLIVRLHRFELFSNPEFPKIINWKNVDALIFDNEFFRRHTVDFIKPECPTFTIPNGLELEKWTFRERNNPKKAPNIAFVGDIGWRKGIQLLCEIINRWPWAKFHLTARQISNDELYMLIGHLGDRYKWGKSGRVTLHPNVEDMNKFLEPMDYLISTSLSESQGMAIAEAMAKGIKPLIYNFPGAASMYPHDLLWATLSELTERKDGNYESKRYRGLIEQWGWTQENQMRGLNRIIAQLKVPKAAEPAAAEAQ